MKIKFQVFLLKFGKKKKKVLNFMKRVLKQFIDVKINCKFFLNYFDLFLNQKKYCKSGKNV